MRIRSSRSILSNLRFPSGFRIGIRSYATTTTTTTTHPVTGPKNNQHPPTAAAAAAAPPPPRPFKPLPAHERIARYPDHALEDSATSTEKKGKGGGRGGGAKEIFSRLWRYASTTSTSSTASTTSKSTTAQPEPIYPSSPDPQRGIEAARRVVREGVLDARYSRAAKNFTLVMCALPIAIYTSYELFQRRFRGKLQKGRVVEREGDGDGGKVK